MAISMLDNISYRGQKPDNERSQFETVADMVAYNENYLPAVYITSVVENGKEYKYQRSNTVDPVTGKWREHGGGNGDLSNYYNKVEVEALVKTAKDIAEDNASHIGSMTSLAVDTWGDLVTAVNALYGSFMSKITYGNKKLTIEYRNGATFEIDVSSVITDTEINEFKNVTIDEESVSDGESLVYDASTKKWINKLIDVGAILQSAKTYTDEEIAKAQEGNAIACDEKPVYDSSTDTVTYKQEGETKTEADTVSWFYYKANGVTVQTRWISGVEFTIDVGAIKLDDYVNKNTDVTGTFEENPADLTKIPNLAYMSALRLVIITALGNKINSDDIVDNLLSETENKPLSARQGKVLDGKIEELKGKVGEKLDIQQDASHAGKHLAVDENGKITFVEGGDADSVAYSNENYPSWDNVTKALNGIIAKVDYVKPEIKAFTMSPSDTVYEVGQSVASLTFNWTLNKEITTQSLTDCVLADENVRSAVFDTPITSAKTFTLSVGDGQNTATKSLSISFRNKIYFGGAAIPSNDNYDSAFILGLAKNQFATSKAGSFTLTCGSGEHGFIAMPSSFGNVDSVKIGGFDTDMTKCGTISFTNASGGVVSYNIFRTGRDGLGTITMEIK